MEACEVLFQLLRLAIDEKQQVPRISPDNWANIFNLAVKQSIEGIVFMGVQRLPQESRPQKTLLLQWFMRKEKIAQTNHEVNLTAVKVMKAFQQAGFRNTMLKGQGNAAIYPEPLVSARTPGDIDIWLTAPPRKVISYVRRIKPRAKACYHHVDFIQVNGVKVEVHYRPSFMNNLINNWRLQRWFRQVADEQLQHSISLQDGTGETNVPTNGFNRIFQIAHIQNHVMNEGIGLRQIMDYYFLLKQGFTEEERRHDERLLKKFGLFGTAKAVMHILQTVFGLEACYLLVPTDKRKGQFLLKEIMMAGNFGRFDERVKNRGNQVARNFERLKRDVRLLRYYPSECLWEPVFRTWHFIWRIGHRW